MNFKDKLNEKYASNRTPIYANFAAITKAWKDAAANMQKYWIDKEKWEKENPGENYPKNHQFTKLNGELTESFDTYKTWATNIQEGKKV